MKNIYIYEKNNDLCLSEFPTLNSAHVSYTIKNKKIHEFLSSINNNIKEIYEKGSSVQIDFGVFIVTINRNLLHNENLKPLMKKINEYNRVKERKQESKKVTRTNRHAGKKIIATGLALLTIYSVAKSIKRSKPDNTNLTTVVSEEDTNQQTETSEVLDSSNEISLNDETTTFTNFDNIDDSKLTNLSFSVKTNDNDCNVYIDYSDFSADEEKSTNVDNNYSSIITKYSRRYGIDPEIMIAIAKQERGFHSTESDGYATGLMQIEDSVWIGESVTAFNYEIDDFETVNITRDLVSSLDGNIQVGCMIFSNTLSQMKNNVLVAIQCYNMGYGNMVYKILREYSYDCGKSVYEILEDPTDVGWLNYRGVVKNQGDKYYLERILAYMHGKLGTDLKIQSLGKNLIINTPSKVKQ